jgi:uncharacterized repeat protein (TIGR01451 family)
LQGILKINKASSTDYAVVSDIITCKIKIQNISDIIAEKVVVKDLLPEELKFILGSVKIDNKEDTYANIISGISLGNIMPNEIKFVSFDAQVVKKKNDYVENNSVVEFRYKNKENLNLYATCNSINKVYIRNPKLKITKKCDKTYVKLDDVISYNLEIYNVGDLNLYNLLLVDELPKSLKLIDGTFTIGNRIVNSVELDKGIILDNIKVNETLTIKYKARVISGNYGNKISNKAKVKYSYILENGVSSYHNSNESVSTIDMAISSFKQISIDEYLTIPLQKPDIEEINDLKVNVKINKYNIVKTSIAKSSEGQILSGYKLVLHGNIDQVVEYTSCEFTQSINSVHYSIPFSSYIILPSDFILGSKLEVQGTIEDVYFTKVNKRCFFRNITVLLIAKIACIN